MNKETQGLVHWLHKRRQAWQRLETLISRQKGRRDEDEAEILELIQGYRSLARDVSLARQALPDSRMTRYLEALFTRAYEVIYQSPYSLWQQITILFRDEIPAVMVSLYRPILASTTIFIITAIMGWWLVYTYPELSSLFASEEMIEHVQQGELWTDGLLNILPSSILSMRIMANNIMVTIFAFGMGVFYGLGTLYIMGLNGFMLGGVFALTYHYGLAGRLFEFIVAHGLVELSVIVLAGAAGMTLGEALIRPGYRTRVDAFQHAVANAGKLIAVGAPLLVGAGLIEGYISPDPEYALSTRISVGVAYWIFMILVLSGRFWPRRVKLSENISAV